MFFKQSWYLNELGDMDIIGVGEELHMFHLELPSHDRVGHAVSRDGMRWKQLPHAIHTGEPGEFDDDMIWTMHAFGWHARFYMLYTALCSRERGRIQRTGLAVSDDLISWRKADHNPVAAPDARWYEADTTSGCGRADWRDPFAWVEDGVIHGLVCAHEKEGPLNRRGCVAHITSTDALHWQVQPPFYSPRISTDYEVPTLLKIDGRYYLIGHICAPLHDVYRVADSLKGPWRRPANDLVLPAPNYAFAPAVFKGRNVLVNWINAQLDWSAEEYEPTVRIITPPREAIASAEGELILRSYQPGWDSVANGKPQAAVIADPAPHAFRGEWETRGNEIRGDSKTGLGLLRLPSSHRDFILETNIVMRGAVELGVFWRADETADACTKVSIIPGRQTIELHRLLVRKEGWFIGRGHDTLQTNHCRMDSDAKPIKVRVIAWGPYVEISVNDRILLCHATMSRRDGHVGFFMEDGSATFTGSMLTTLHPPDGFETL